MRAALACLLLVAVPGPANPRPEDFVGTWQSRTERSEGTLTLQRDGTFEYRPGSESRTIFGRWGLQGRAIVWTYTLAPGVELDPSSQPDVNPIVELSSDRFVLRETDRTLSVFRRLSSSPQPLTTHPSPAETPPPLETSPRPLVAPLQPLQEPDSSRSDLLRRLWAAVVVAAVLVFAFFAWRTLRGRASRRAGRTLYPCLKETTWIGQGLSVRRPLADVAGAEWVPWVSLGYDHPDTFEFLSEQALRESGRSASDLEAEALANLRHREASWQMVSIGLASGVEVQVAMCSDDFFAAERILEPELILDAQERLGASELYAAVPRRGLLALVDTEAGAEAIAWFVMWAAQEHFGGRSAPISPMVFRMSRGRIVGALPSPPRQATAPG